MVINYDVWYFKSYYSPYCWCLDDDGTTAGRSAEETFAAQGLTRNAVRGRAYIAPSHRNISSDVQSRLQAAEAGLSPSEGRRDERWPGAFRDCRTTRWMGTGRG